MGIGFLLLGPTIGVVVQREGSSYKSVGARQGIGVPVLGAIGGRKDDHAIEHRGYHLVFVHTGVPEFELTPPCLIPIVVQVDQNIDSAIQLPRFVVVEVDMDLQKSPWLDLVQTSAFESGDRGSDPRFRSAIRET